MMIAEQLRRRSAAEARLRRLGSVDPARYEYLWCNTVLRDGLMPVLERLDTQGINDGDQWVITTADGAHALAFGHQPTVDEVGQFLADAGVMAADQFAAKAGDQQGMYAVLLDAHVYLCRNMLDLMEAIGAYVLEQT